MYIFIIICKRVRAFFRLVFTETTYIVHCILRYSTVYRPHCKLTITLWDEKTCLWFMVYCHQSYEAKKNNVIITMSDVEGKQTGKHKCITKEDQIEGFQNKTSYFICVLVSFLCCTQKVVGSLWKILYSTTVHIRYSFGLVHKGAADRITIHVLTRRKICKKIGLEKACSRADQKIFKIINISIAGK